MLCIARCASAVLCSVVGLVGLVRSLDSSRSDVLVRIGLGGCGVEEEEVAAVLGAALVVFAIVYYYSEGLYGGCG